MTKTQLLKKGLWIMCILVSVFLFVNIAIAADYYEVKLLYDKGNITLGSINIKELNKTRNLPGGYVAEIVDSKDNVLNVTFFDIPLKILYDTIDNVTGKLSGGGEIILEQQNFTLMLPYFENANALNIYDKTINKKFSMDLQKYSPTIKKEIEKEQITEEKKPDYVFFSIFTTVVIIVTVIIVYAIKRFNKK
ncbi:hypothetical protein HYU06_00250 [Candidatus Woesearchaeota archaeon]|nr:hypothetical protein [Candidatus Woesearchaeota archaeon]